MSAASFALDGGVTPAQYDVVIVGGGMVGTMLAAALGHLPMSVAVVESSQPAPFDASAQPDLRVSALSMASERMLRAVGVWSSIDAMRACPYSRMRVWDGEAEGQTHFFSGDVGQTHLGHIVENRVLQIALTERLANFDQLDYLCPNTLKSIEHRDDCVILTLDDARELHAKLVVGADGASSKVRTQANIGYTTSQYPQHALVATIKTSLAQQAVTWQRFLPTGPQAFLPLTDAHASMVWYHTAEEVTRLKSLPDVEFCTEMENAFPSCLGKIDTLYERGSFPLMRGHAHRYVQPRIALIGDAAHTVHPLAGQGVNLGFLDAAVLAQVLATSQRQGKDVGDLHRLCRYERWRRPENAIMLNALDGFYHAFKPQPKAVRKLRSLFLDVANRSTPLKNFVTGYAMGVRGDLPDLAKGQLP